MSLIFFASQLCHLIFIKLFTLIIKFGVLQKLRIAKLKRKIEHTVQIFWTNKEGLLFDVFISLKLKSIHLE